MEELKALIILVLLVDVVAVGAIAAMMVGGGNGQKVAEPPVTGVVDAFRLYTTTGSEVFNGTLVGDVRANETPGGTIFYFNGSGYVNLSNALPSLNGLKTGSISLFFRFERSGQNVLPILYIGDRKGENMFIDEIGHRGGGNRRLYVTWVADGKPFLCFDSGFNLKPGRWYHLVVVVGENGNTAYLNGREMRWRHYNFGNESMRAFIWDIPKKEAFFIGYGKTADPITSKFLYFKGSVADVRFYTEPLGWNEIREILGEARRLILPSP